MAPADGPGPDGPPVNGTGCPDTIEIERLADGAPPTPAQASHLGQCQSCRDRLAASQNDATFLTRVRRLVSPALSPDGAPRIPGYRIQDLISRGAQGVVYRAVQESTSRAVAIKVLQGNDAASSRQRARAEREAEIAARLRHPNIVTVFESRKLGDGRVAVIMEFVDGVALDAWKPAADNDSQRLRRWLETFSKVCDAVHHAHLNGVIHRDLKPANVLVTSEARPVVLDFGIAKTEGLHTTRTGEFAGTPAYASPEQVAGHPGGVDALTDVYSLGVVLYHAACGSMPYELEGSMFAMAQTIATIPPRPPREKNPAIAPDLEAIILRALRKEKEFRYQSAAALARDIDRFLAGEPVDARAGSGWYVLRKALAMNRRRLGWAAAALALLLVAVGAVLWSMARAAESSRRAAFEREQAIAENVRARAVTELLREALPSADPAHPEVASAIASGLSHLYFRLESGGFADEPALDQAVRRLWGSIYTGLGSGKAAQLVEYAEVSLRNGLVRLRLQHPGGEHPDIAAATYELAGVLLVRKRFEEAEAAAAQALAMHERMHGPNHLATAESRSLRARALAELDRGPDALREADLALAVLRQLPQREADLGAASLLELKARLASSKGSTDSAEILVREALTRRLRRLPPDDAELLACLTTSATLAQSLPDSTLAQAMCQAWDSPADALPARIAADLPLLARTRTSNRAIETTGSGRTNALQRFIRLQTNLLGPNDLSIIASHLTLLRVAGAESICDVWAQSAEHAAESLTKRFGPHDFSVLLCLEQAAVAWVHAGDPARAVTLAQRACDIWDHIPAYARDPLFPASSRRRLATYQNMAGQFDAAKSVLASAMTDFHAAVGTDSYLYASAEAMLALAHADSGELRLADEHSAHALEVAERSPATAPDQLYSIKYSRAHALVKLGRTTEALPLLQQAWDGFWHRLNPEHPWRRRLIADFVLTCESVGDTARAAHWRSLLSPTPAAPSATPPR